MLSMPNGIGGLFLVFIGSAKVWCKDRTCFAASQTIKQVLAKLFEWRM